MENTNDIVLAESQELAAQSDSMTSFADLLMQEVTERGYYATFEVETMDDKKRLFNARQDNVMLRDAEGEIIPCVGFVLDTIQINDIVSGSMKTVPAAHIIAEDGTVYQSASTGVVRSVCKIIDNFGLPETWGGALNVTLKDTTTRTGFNYKYLDVV